MHTRSVHPESLLGCQGKHGEFGNFAKTQGIWSAQVVISLILKGKDISIMAETISNFISSWISLTLPSQFCVCNTNSHKSCKSAQGKVVVRQGKNRENTEF